MCVHSQPSLRARWVRMWGEDLCTFVYARIHERVYAHGYSCLCIRTRVFKSTPNTHCSPAEKHSGSLSVYTGERVYGLCVRVRSCLCVCVSSVRVLDWTGDDSLSVRI